MRPLGKGGGILIPRIRICRFLFFMSGGHNGWEALYEKGKLISMMRLFNPMRHGAIGVGGKFVIVASVPFGGWGAPAANSGGNIKKSILIYYSNFKLARS